MLAGGAVLTFLLVHFGHSAWHAITTVSLTDFLIYILAQLLLTAGLACCWCLVLPRRDGRTPVSLLMWGRILRDAAGEFLPFSYAGGLVIGARAITLFGVPAGEATTSTILDATVEAAAEIIFVALGMVILACSMPETRLWLPKYLAIAAVLAGAVSIAVLSRRHWSGTPLRLVLRKLSPLTAVRLNRITSAVREISARPSAITKAAVAHLVCAFSGGAVTWWGFHMLEAPISLLAAMSFEAMIHVCLMLSFFVPARLGVQEAAYLLLGTIYGLPPELTISLSLLRRGRNFVISLPALISWQFFEARKLASRRWKTRLGL
jgi:putative membrane protein